MARLHSDKRKMATGYILSPLIVLSSGFRCSFKLVFPNFDVNRLIDSRLNSHPVDLATTNTKWTTKLRHLC
jgi:hypothetical protein